MRRPLYALKSGTPNSGLWDWAVAADNRLSDTRPLCIATINFHGAIAAGHDPEILAVWMAAAPELRAALKELHGALVGRVHSQPALSALAKAEEALAKADAIIPEIPTPTVAA